MGLGTQSEILRRSRTAAPADEVLDEGRRCGCTGRVTARQPDDIIDDRLRHRNTAHRGLDLLDVFLAEDRLDAGLRLAGRLGDDVGQLLVASG